MSAWQARLEKTLGDADAPPVLTRDLLRRYATSARQRVPIPDSSLTWWIRRALTDDKIRIVQRGLYLNRMRNPPGQLADAIAHLHKDAVVSLNSVLGDAGILNNPSHTVTAVVPIDAGHPAPKLGRRPTKAGSLHFFGLPRRILEAGEADDRLEPRDRVEHLRATPEKALIDWLYLAQSSRSKRAPPAKHNVDVGSLDRPRLARLARAAGLQDTLTRWLAA